MKRIAVYLILFTISSVAFISPKVQPVAGQPVEGQQTELHSEQYWYDYVKNKFLESDLTCEEGVIQEWASTFYLQERGGFLDTQTYNLAYWKDWIFDNSFRIVYPDILRDSQVEMLLTQVAQKFQDFMTLKISLDEMLLELDSYFNSATIDSIRIIEFSDSYFSVNVQISADLFTHLDWMKVTGIFEAKSALTGVIQYTIQTYPEMYLDLNAWGPVTWVKSFTSSDFHHKGNLNDVSILHTEKYYVKVELKYFDLFIIFPITHTIQQTKDTVLSDDDVDAPAFLSLEHKFFSQSTYVGGLRGFGQNPPTSALDVRVRYSDQSGLDKLFATVRATNEFGLTINSQSYEVTFTGEYATITIDPSFWTASYSLLYQIEMTYHARDNDQESYTYQQYGHSHYVDDKTSSADRTDIIAQHFLGIGVIDRTLTLEFNPQSCSQNLPYPNEKVSHQMKVVNPQDITATIISVQYALYLGTTVPPYTTVTLSPSILLSPGDQVWLPIIQDDNLIPTSPGSWNLKVRLNFDQYITGDYIEQVFSITAINPESPSVSYSLYNTGINIDQSDNFFIPLPFRDDTVYKPYSLPLDIRIQNNARIPMSLSSQNLGFTIAATSKTQGVKIYDAAGHNLVTGPAQALLPVSIASGGISSVWVYLKVDDLTVGSESLLSPASTALSWLDLALEILQGLGLGFANLVDFLNVYGYITDFTRLLQIFQWIDHISELIEVFEIATTEVNMAWTGANFHIYESVSFQIADRGTIKGSFSGYNTEPTLFNDKSLKVFATPSAEQTSKIKTWVDTSIAQVILNLITLGIGIVAGTNPYGWLICLGGAVAGLILNYVASDAFTQANRNDPPVEDYTERVVVEYPTEILIPPVLQGDAELYTALYTLKQDAGNLEALNFAYNTMMDRKTQASISGEEGAIQYVAIHAADMTTTLQEIYEIERQLSSKISLVLDLINSRIREFGLTNEDMATSLEAVREYGIPGDMRTFLTTGVAPPATGLPNLGGGGFLTNMAVDQLVSASTIEDIDLAIMEDVIPTIESHDEITKQVEVVAMRIIMNEYIAVMEEWADTNPAIQLGLLPTSEQLASLATIKAAILNARDESKWVDVRDLASQLQREVLELTKILLNSDDPDLLAYYAFAEEMIAEVKRVQYLHVSNIDLFSKLDLEPYERGKVKFFLTANAESPFILDFEPTGFESIDLITLDGESLTTPEFLFTPGETYVVEIYFHFAEPQDPADYGEKLLSIKLWSDISIYAGIFFNMGVRVLLSPDDDSTPPLINADQETPFFDSDVLIGIAVKATDASGIASVTVEMGGNTYSTLFNGEKYQANLPNPRELGTYSFSVTAWDGDDEYSDDSLWETISGSFQVSDDDTTGPIITIVVDRFALNPQGGIDVWFTVQAVDPESGIDPSQVRILAGDQSFSTLGTHVITVLSLHTITITAEVTNADLDRGHRDQERSVTPPLTVSITADLVKGIILESITAGRGAVQESRDDEWDGPAANRKNAMIEKLGDLALLVTGGNYATAYDKLLHDIKPKLTGLKSDEHEVPWGDGAFNKAWVTNPGLQEDFRPWANALLHAIRLIQ